MSKSDPSDLSRINFNDTNDLIQKKFIKLKLIYMMVYIMMK